MEYRAGFDFEYDKDDDVLSIFDYNKPVSESIEFNEFMNIDINPVCVFDRTATVIVPIVGTTVNWPVVPLSAHTALPAITNATVLVALITKLLFESVNDTVIDDMLAPFAVKITGLALPTIFVAIPADVTTVVLLDVND